MSEHDAADIGRTFNCKFDDCTQPARTNRGPTAYLCDEHKQRRAAQAATKPKTGGLASAVSQLAAAAKNADKLAAHAKKLTERALAAKANADKAADDVRRAARELIEA